MNTLVIILFILLFCCCVLIAVLWRFLLAAEARERNWRDLTESFETSSRFHAQSAIEMLGIVEAYKRTLRNCEAKAEEQGYATGRLRGH